MKKETSHTINWENISNYLSGEMSAEERNAFEKLIDTNPEYAKIIAASEKDLQHAGKLHEIQNRYDSNAAWPGVKSRIQNSKPKTTAVVLQWKQFMRIAAMLVIAIGLGLFSYQVYTKHIDPYQSIASAANETGKVILLSDGSRVTLNGEAKLVFPRKFAADLRKVELVGEAFFDIAKNAEKPFVISAKNAEIKVLGTSFNVIAKNNKVEVLVATGKVQFLAKENPEDALILEKGDFGILEKNILEKTRMNDDNYLSWKTQRMIFKNTPLKEVAKVLNRTYQVQIEFQDTGMMNNKITTSFEETPLDVVLENLCRPFGLAYEKNGNRIVIKRDLE